MFVFRIAHLGNAGLDDPRVGVPDMGDVVHAVEVCAAVRVVQVGALAADDVERRPVADRQRRPEQPAARRRGGRRRVVTRRPPRAPWPRPDRSPASRSRSAQAGASEIVRYGSSGSRRDWWALSATLVARRSATSSAIAPRSSSVSGSSPRTRTGSRRRPPAGPGRRAPRTPRRRPARSPMTDHTASPRSSRPVIRVDVHVDEDVVVVRVVVDDPVAQSRHRRRASGSEPALPGQRAAPPGGLGHGVGVRRDHLRGRARPPTGRRDGRPGGPSRRAPGRSGP